MLRELFGYLEESVTTCQICPFKYWLKHWLRV